MRYSRSCFVFLLVAAAILFVSCGQPAQNSPVPESVPSEAVQPADAVNAKVEEPPVENKVVDTKDAAGDAVNADENAADARAVVDVEPDKAVAAAEDTGAAEENGAEEKVAEEAAAPAAANRIDSMDALSEEQQQILSSIEWDVDPEILNAVEQKNEGGHFPFSDEKHLDLFKDHITDLGGTYIGVGTDQGYLFIGWQRPTLGFVIDYDPWVVIIHKIYMAFWKECEDSACLHHYFDDRELGMEFMKSEKGIAAGLDKELPLKVYKTTQRSIARQLKRVERMNVKTFMNDAESFQYIKKMIELGRIRTLQANLLGDKAFASIAAAMNKLDAKVTTFYLSNAEQYWGYSSQFKKNIIGMPISDKALILRTSATYPNNNDYRYSIQPISVFKAWLQHPEGKTVRAVTKRVRVKDPEDFPFVVDDFLPPQAEE